MSLRYPLAPSVQFMSPKTQNACRYNKWTALTKQKLKWKHYRNINPSSAGCISLQWSPEITRMSRSSNQTAHSKPTMSTKLIWNVPQPPPNSYRNTSTIYSKACLPASPEAFRFTCVFLHRVHLKLKTMAAHAYEKVRDNLNKIWPAKRTQARILIRDARGGKMDHFLILNHTHKYKVL